MTFYWLHNSRQLSETDQAWRASGSESQPTWSKRKSTKPHASWLTSITTHRTWQELLLTAFLMQRHSPFCRRPDLMLFGLIIDITSAFYWNYSVLHGAELLFSLCFFLLKQEHKHTYYILSLPIYSIFPSFLETHWLWIQHPKPNQTVQVKHQRSIVFVLTVQSFKYTFLPYMPIFGIQSLNISENKSLCLMSFSFSSKCFFI